jgi:hypothetical protein
MKSRMQRKIDEEEEDDQGDEHEECLMNAENDLDGIK